MKRRFLIPEGEGPESASPVLRDGKPVPYFVVANEGGVGLLEGWGSQWRIDNGYDTDPAAWGFVDEERVERSRRLVIPADASVQDPSPIYEGLPARYPKDHPDPDLAGTEIVPPQPQDGARFFTWQEVADDSKVDAIENLGSRWCLDNKVDGLGIAEELPPPPPPLRPTVSVKISRQEILDAKDALAVVLDPALPKGQVDARLERLEKLVAGLIDGRVR